MFTAIENCRPLFSRRRERVAQRGSVAHALRNGPSIKREIFSNTNCLSTNGTNDDFPVCQQMEHDSQRLAPRKANAMTAGSLDSDASLCRRVGRRHHHGERERVQEVVLRRAERCGSRVAASRWLRSTLGAVIPWAKPATTRLEEEERAGHATCAEKNSA